MVLEPSGTASGPMDRPQGSSRPWNARRAILYCSLAGDIISVLLSSGTRLGAIGAAAGFWNARKALRGRGTSAGLFCIVRWQEILSPSYYPLERAKRNWNGPWPMERPPASETEPWLYLERPPSSGTEPLALPGTPQGVSKNHYYTRATHGIVEVMWSNRGAFVERGFLSGGPRELCSNGERRRCGALQVSDPGRDFR